MVSLHPVANPAYPCCQCQQYVSMSAAGWMHGFGWSRCPTCSAGLTASQTSVTLGQFMRTHSTGAAPHVPGNGIVVHGSGNLTDGTPVEPVIVEMPPR